jgi:hypothetical protein
LDDGRLEFSSSLDVQTKHISATPRRWMAVFDIKIDHESNLVLILERPCQTTSIIEHGRPSSILASVGSPDLALNSTVFCSVANDHIVLEDLDRGILHDLVGIDVHGNDLARIVEASTLGEDGGKLIL